jgi:aldehyde:ferredoxin oxidoreductase
MKKIFRVNIRTLSITEGPVPEAFQRLGGRGMTSAIVSTEVPPKCHPLSAENKLVIATGLLAGSLASTSGRLSVGAKSPLTGGIKESSAGGTVGQALGWLDVAAIVVEDRPDDPNARYVLKVDRSGLTIENMPELAGLGNYDTCDTLREKYGEKKTSFMTIGPVGEMKLASASIAVVDREGNPTRHAGRGGLGAVMGAKGVKAIVVDTEGVKRPPGHDPKAMQQASKRLAKLMADHSTSGETLPRYGTNALAEVINAAGAYPTRNFATGTFEGVHKISGEAERDIIIERDGAPEHACQTGCTIQCSSIYNDEGGEYLSKGPEYETVWAHGGNCAIDDLDAIARMDRLDDDLGLDTIEMGCAIAVAMEGGLIPFGDAAGVIRLLDEDVRNGTPLGRILASGTETTGRVFGVSRIPCVKGQAMPAYDPRAAKGIGVTYATTPMGADHTAGYAIAQNILGVGGDVPPLQVDGQVDLSRELQIATAGLDSTGLCLFVAFPMLDEPEVLQKVLDILSAYRGETWSADDFADLGRKTLQREIEFNRRAGFSAEDDRLPDFCRHEPLAPHDSVFDVPDEELDKVHEYAR